MDCGPRCRSKQHAASLLTAITRGNLRQIQLFLTKCYSAALVSDSTGRTCLHMAASKGKWDVVAWLLEEKHADVSTKDLESGWTALHRAVFYGQLSAARVLKSVSIYVIHLTCVNFYLYKGLSIFHTRGLVYHSRLGLPCIVSYKPS